MTFGPRDGSRALAQAALLFIAVAGSASAQTVEPRYDPHATGAATIIYPDETALGALRFLELLRWHVPGIEINDSIGGLKIYLRGGGIGLANEPPNPLLIIDGAKVSEDFFESEIRSLNPFRIERIEVLRDVASSTVYGVRAAGGVILVFTRRR
jgi:TonB-dependent SusC/RagA subfamily outer membrane receptor